MNKNRLEAFSDGVFSIVITLLVLDIKFPEKEILTNGELLATIRDTLPNIYTYIFTFLVVGLFWVAHNRVFAFVKQVDHYLLWANIFYLLTIAIIPYPASILAKYSFFTVSIVFYSSVLFLCGLQHFHILNYLRNHPECSESFFEGDARKQILRLSLVGPGLSALAIMSSLIVPAAGLIFLLLMLLFSMFFAQRFDRFKRNAQKNAL